MGKDVISIKIIKTIEGIEVLVDEEDYLYIFNCYDLKIDTNGYVYCCPKKKWKKAGLFSMTLHKLLKNPDKTGRSIVVDHKDGNKLNNQKENLRVCSHQKNMRNRKPHNTYGSKETTSKYKGVSKSEFGKGGWEARIAINKRVKNLGKFDNEIAAVNCYNYHALKLFGEFAKLNENIPYMSEEEWMKHRYSKIKTSNYKGVSLVDGKYLAQIYHDNRNVRIGSFDNEDDAAIAYNSKATELRGSKAKLNIYKSRCKENLRESELIENVCIL